MSNRVRIRSPTSSRLRKRSASASPDAAEISSACDYYRKILPFYERESLSRAHLEFWSRIAREVRPERILEIGAGLGRITSGLSAVAPAVGLDISLEMLALAQRRSSRRALFAAADARRATFAGVFDLIVAPGDPFCHMMAFEDRRRALRAIADQLSPRGVFVLEGLYRPRRGVAHPMRRIPYAEGVLSIDEAWVPFGTREMWHARYRYRDQPHNGRVRRMDAGFLARAWNPATIRSLFAACGLDVAELWGGFDRRPFEPDAVRMLAVARAAAGSVRVRPGRGLAIKELSEVVADASRSE